MYGKNDELLVRIFGENYFTNQPIKASSIEKERRYQQAYLPKLKLMDGLQQLLDQCKATGIKMAIGSAAIPFNIEFVLANLQLHSYFPVVVNADDVAICKPDPETSLLCVRQLDVASLDCIVFEDAPKGVESAYNAGMPCFVLTTTHPKEDFAAYYNIIGYASNYNSLTIETNYQPQFN